jgi:hypothetical protein
MREEEPRVADTVGPAWRCRHLSPSLVGPAYQVRRQTFFRFFTEWASKERMGNVELFGLAHFLFLLYEVRYGVMWTGAYQFFFKKKVFSALFKASSSFHTIHA